MSTNRTKTTKQNDGDPDAVKTYNDQDQGNASQPAEEVGKTPATDALTNDRVIDCPECSGRVRDDPSTGERLCDSCGLVIDDDRIDLGPDWRAFSQQERSEKSRIGGPRTELLHDHGLTTNISWKDKDARGNHLSANQRSKFHRLRTWNERFRTRNSKERGMKHAFSEIERIASALGLPETTQEMAGLIYRRCAENDLLVGRSIEGMSSAAMYAAAREEKQPRTLDEIAGVSRVDRTEIARTYRYIARELGLKIKPIDPQAYIPRVLSKLDIDDPENTFENKARTLLNDMDGTTLSGKAPIGVAAAAIYAASEHTGREVTQTRLSEIADVSTVTIRNRYNELAEAHPDYEC